MKHSPDWGASTLVLGLFFHGTVMAQSAGKPALTERPAPGDFRVVEGRVDPGTFAGWRVFHTACYGCHGLDAKGTSVAPNLVERIRNLTPRAFATKVFTSYRIALPPGDPTAQEPSETVEAQVEQALRRQRLEKGQLVMPAWEGSEPVNAHVLDLYAYLSARADGSLGPGKPKVMTSKMLRKK